MSGGMRLSRIKDVELETRCITWDFSSLSLYASGPIHPSPRWKTELVNCSTQRRLLFPKLSGVKDAGSQDGGLR